MGYERDWSGFAAFTFISFIAASIAAFITHVWWIITVCMSGVSVTGGQVLIAVLGIMIPPFGALHGVWLWFH